MVDFFIYSGLIILLVGSLYGIFVAVKGFRSRADGQRPLVEGFGFGPVSPRMRRLIWIWGIIMIAGFVLTAIGLTTGSK